MRIFWQFSPFKRLIASFKAFSEILERFNSLAPRTREEWMESTLNKVNAFLSDDRIREMFSFEKSSFSLREIMDSQKILLIKLDRGRLKENADLISSLLMMKIRMAAFSRSDVPREKRIPFYLYIDEFQNFATKTFIDTLSEARKYGLSLIMAHQNLSQLPKDLQDSILTNCGIQCYFRVSRRDAEILAKEAFETTGLEVKASRLSPRYFDYDFYSYPEEKLNKILKEEWVMNSPDPIAELAEEFQVSENFMRKRLEFAKLLSQTESKI